MALEIDHVIYAVADLDAAARRLREEHGLGSVDGGRHPGHGTANRIVPLGSDYLELLSVVDEEEAGASAFGSAVLGAVAGGDRLAGWAVRTGDLAADARRLDLDVQEMRRAAPDGTELRWRHAGVAASLAAPHLPFFIQWDVEPALHPGRAGADHRVAPRGIAWLEIGGERAELSAWLGGAELPLRFAAAGRAVEAVGIATGDGEIVLR